MVTAVDEGLSKEGRGGERELAPSPYHVLLVATQTKRRLPTLRDLTPAGQHRATNFRDNHNAYVLASREYRYHGRTKTTPNYVHNATGTHTSPNSSSPLVGYILAATTNTIPSHTSSIPKGDDVRDSATATEIGLENKC